MMERSTVEYTWQVRSRSRKDPEKRAAKSSSTRGVDTTPRLVWFQQDQEVSDKKFKGYAILAGAKQHIVSSSRLEDTRNLIKSVKPEEPIESTGKSEQTIEQVSLLRTLSNCLTDEVIGPS